MKLVLPGEIDTVAVCGPIAVRTFSSLCLKLIADALRAAPV